MVGLVFAAKLDVVAVESQNNASCMRGDVMVCGACSMPEEWRSEGGMDARGVEGRVEWFSRKKR